jgi:hypothetical protein
MTSRFDSFVRRAGIALVSAGIDPRRMWRAVRSLPPYVASLMSARRSASPDWPVVIGPVFGDRYESAGTAQGHYFHMDLWAARQVLRGGFERVIDVGSRIDGYVAHVLVFREIEVFDVRSLHSRVPGLRFTQANLTEHGALPTQAADCVSCLHALEHFGLGRYGDPLDVQGGWKNGLAGLARIVAEKGTLLLAVPVGRQRIEFDAHRVFRPGTIVDEAARHALELVDFSYVDDGGDFHESAALDAAGTLDYGCGCFRFMRRGA